MTLIDLPAPAKPRRLGTKDQVTNVGWGTLGVVLALGVWEASTASGLLGSGVPTAHAVAAALAGQLGEAGFWTSTGETLSVWALGLLIGALIGIVCGTAIGLSRVIENSVTLVIDFLRPIPSVALIPLAVLVLGTQSEMRVTLVVVATTWPMLFSTVYGIRDVDPVTKEMARAYGLSRARTLWTVVLRGATPYVFTSIRVSATVALVVTIATEIIADSAGLGFLLTQLRQADRLADAFAVMFMTGVLGLLIATMFGAIEAKSLHWHHSRRTGVR